MAWFYFRPMPVIDPVTGTPLHNVVGRVYAENDISFTTPLVVHDMNGIPMDRLEVGDMYTTPAFQVENRHTVVWKSGHYSFPITSMDGLIQVAREAAELTSSLLAEVKAVAAEVQTATEAVADAKNNVKAARQEAKAALEAARESATASIAAAQEALRSAKEAAKAAKAAEEAAQKADNVVEPIEIETPTEEPK